MYDRVALCHVIFFCVSCRVMNIPCHAASGFFCKVSPCTPLYNMLMQKIGYILGRGRAYIFSTCGYRGAIWSQFFLICPQLVGTWVQNMFKNLVQILGVSCSKYCVSWRVNIYCVNKFRVVSCQNSACQRVHAMSRPPWYSKLRRMVGLRSWSRIEDG